MAFEVVDSFATHVRFFAAAMAAIGDHDEVEVFVGFDEVVDDLVGGGGVYVGVHFSDGQEEVAGEVVNMGAIGVFDVGFVDGPIEPLFIPPDFVHAVVMATAVGDGDFVKIAMVEEGCGGGLSAS